MSRIQDIEIVRKRPKQDRAKYTVDCILAATARILLEEGEAKLTTNRIASKAGVSIGSVYQYFPDKDAIMQALTLRHRETVQRRVLEILDDCQDEPFETTLRRIIRVLIDMSGTGRTARKSMLVAGMRLSVTHGLPVDLSPVTDRIITAWRATPQTGKTTLSDCEAFVLSRAIRGFLRQAVLENSEWLDSPALEDALVRLVLGFLRESGGDTA